MVPRVEVVPRARRNGTGTCGATAGTTGLRTTGSRRSAGPPGRGTSATGQWYLHLFLAEQPDLDWANPEVVDAMHDVLRFWLDRGVDGFRADVIHLIGKDEALPDQPAEIAHLDIVGAHEHPRTHALLRDIRRLLDSYPGERVMVGEVPLRAAGPARPLLRRRRRAPHGVRLRADAPAVERRGVRGRDPRCRAVVRAARAVALLGPVEPRPAASPLALGRLGGARSCRCRPAPHPARDAVPLRGRGARAARRRGPRCSARGSRRPRRIARADSLGRARRSTAGSPTPGCRGRPSRNGGTPRARVPIRTRSWRSTGDCSRSGGAPRRSSSEAGSCSTRRAGTLVYERSREGDTRRVAVNFGDRRAPDVSAADGWDVEITTGRGARRPALGRIPRARRGGHPHSGVTIRR